MCHLVVMWVSGRRSAFGLSLFLLFDFLFDFWRLLLGLEQGLLALFQHLPQVFRGFQLLISRGGCVQAAKKVIVKVTEGISIFYSKLIFCTTSCMTSIEASRENKTKK